MILFSKEEGFIKPRGIHFKEEQDVNIKLPEVAIGVFSRHLFEDIVQKFSCKEVGYISCANLERNIYILKYKEKEFTERWSYELAKLYYQNGDTQKCLSLCDEMVLWFSDGKYVMKALDLKNRMGMLTGEEKEKYDSQFIPKLTPVEDADSINEEKPAQEVKTAEEDGPVIESVAIDERDVNSAESLQEKISKGIRDIFSGNKKKETEE